MQDWAAVQRIYRETKSLRAIAWPLDMARNTVRSLLYASEDPKYNRTVCKSVIDDYKEQIIERRCKLFEYNGTQIFRELQKIGYKGSIGPVYRFLRRLDEDTGQASSKACERIETPVGDQAQFDWSEYSVALARQEKSILLDHQQPVHLALVNFRDAIVCLINQFLSSGRTNVIHSESV